MGMMGVMGMMSRAPSHYASAWMKSDRISNRAAMERRSWAAAEADTWVVEWEL